MSDSIEVLGTTFVETNTDLTITPNSEVVVKANKAELIAWLVLNIWPSHLGLPLLISTILLAKNIRRHATFINMCVTWMIVGFSSSLLLYAGFQTGPEPPQMLCLVQASILYAQPGMTSLSAFGLVYQVFYVVRATFLEKDPQHHHCLRKWVLLIAPYVALLVFSGLTAFVGATSPELVSRQRRFFYCSVKSSLLTNSITIFSFCVLLVTIVLECWIAHLTYKHWRTLRANELNERTGMDLNLILRTAAFGVWVFLGMCLSMLSIRAPESPVPDLALATMGSAVVIVFGTQRDVLRAWMFWKREDDGLRRLDFDTSPGPLKPTMSYDDDREKSFGYYTPSISTGKQSPTHSHDSTNEDVLPRRSGKWYSRMFKGNGKDRRDKQRPIISPPIVREDSMPPFAVAL